MDSVAGILVEVVVLVVLSAAMLVVARIAKLRAIVVRFPSTMWDAARGVVEGARI